MIRDPLSIRAEDRVLALGAPFCTQACGPEAGRPSQKREDVGSTPTGPATISAALAVVDRFVGATDLPPIPGVSRLDASGLADVRAALVDGDLDAALDACPRHEAYDDIRAAIDAARAFTDVEPVAA